MPPPVPGLPSATIVKCVFERSAGGAVIERREFQAQLDWIFPTLLMDGSRLQNFAAKLTDPSIRTGFQMIDAATARWFYQPSNALVTTDVRDGRPLRYEATGNELVNGAATGVAFANLCLPI
jgi:hypothetical protein